MKLETIQYVPLLRIACRPQVRETTPAESDLIGLARSIQECGLQQPIRVRRDGERFIIVDGHRRLAAVSKIPGSTTIAAIIDEQDLCEAEIIQRQLVANCQRVDLTALERARGISRLMDATGWPAKQAAGKLGLSSSMVSKLLALLSLPEAIREQVAAGTIPATSAYQLTRVAEPAHQAALADQLARGEIRRDDVNRPTNGVDHGQARSRRARAVLGNGASVTVVAEDLTLERFIATLKGVLAQARKARRRGIELPTFCLLLRKKSKA